MFPSEEMVTEVMKVIETQEEFKTMLPVSKDYIKDRLQHFAELQGRNAAAYLAHTLHTNSEDEPIDKMHRMLIFCLSMLVEDEVTKYEDVDVNGLIRAVMTLGYMLRVDEERGIIHVESSSDQSTNHLQGE